MFIEHTNITDSTIYICSRRMQMNRRQCGRWFKVRTCNNRIISELIHDSYACVLYSHSLGSVTDISLLCSEKRVLISQSVCSWRNFIFIFFMSTKVFRKTPIR